MWMAGSAYSAVALCILALPTLMDVVYLYKSGTMLTCQVVLLLLLLHNKQRSFYRMILRATHSAIYASTLYAAAIRMTRQQMQR